MVRRVCFDGSLSVTMKNFAMLLGFNRLLAPSREEPARISVPIRVYSMI